MFTSFVVHAVVGLTLGLILHQINFRIIARIIGPITVSQVSPIDQCWVHRRGDTQMKDATRNLASSTKTRKSFATNFGNKLDPLDS